MQTKTTCGFAASLLITGVATAGLSWGVNAYVLDADGNPPWKESSGVVWVADLYATFSAPTVIEGLSDMVIHLEGAIIRHNDLNSADGGTGSWSPMAFDGSVGNPAIDSFVVLGTFGDFVTPDAGWGPGGFESGGASIPVFAGWFNTNPMNQAGASFTQGGFEHATWVARFCIEFTGSGFPSATLTVAGTVFGEFGELSNADSFRIGPIPVPGALAMLGLAGLVRGRRRRI